MYNVQILAIIVLACGVVSCGQGITIAPQATTIVTPDLVITSGVDILELPGVVEVPRIPVLQRTIWGFSLSADGEKIAFVAIAEDCPYCDPDLFAIDTTTWEARRLTYDANVCSPFWTPNGQWIGYTRCFASEIWLVEPGEEPTQLALGDRAAWSPDGLSIAVADNTWGTQDDELEFSIQIVDPMDGTGEQLIHHNVAFDPGAGLTWSPDGDYLALAIQDEFPAARVYGLDVETRELVAMAQWARPGIVIHDWTADGKWIAVSVLGTGGFLRSDGACWVIPDEINFEGARWRAFSGRTAKLLVYYHGFYIIDLREALGSGFPEGVLSCP